MSDPFLSLVLVGAAVAAFALGRRMGYETGLEVGRRQWGGGRQVMYQLGHAEGFHEGWAERGRRFAASAGKQAVN